MDFRLGLAVNAWRRFVKDEHLWRWNQPVRQQPHLLVAAGEGVGQLLDSRCDNSHPTSEIPGDLRLLRAVDDAKSVGQLPKDRERRVRANWKRQHEPLLVTVFGH